MNISPLASLRQARPGKRSAGALAVSIAIHAGLASLVLFAAQSLAPPAMKRTATILLPLPPKAGAPPIKKGVRHPRPAKPAAAQSVEKRVPARIPDKLPVAPARTDSAAVADAETFQEEGPLGDPEGSESGSSEGIPGSDGIDGGSDFGVDGGVSTGGEILDVALARAHLLKKVAPLYPVIAKKAGIEGTVILVAVIGTDGRVEDLRVLRSISLLDQAALDAVSQWIFEPARRNGHAVRMRLTVSVLFHLGR